jgi:hypothetical protein
MLQRALLAFLTSLLVGACSGPAARLGPETWPGNEFARMSSAERAQAQTELEPILPAFASLEKALAERDDEAARRILTRIQARDPKGIALRRAQAFERIVEGREWTRSLRLWLTVERLGDTETWVVKACAVHSPASDFTLRGAPPTLRLAILGVNDSGMEQRFMQQNQIDWLSTWRLPAGVETALEIERVEIPPGSAMAVRAQFSLEFLGGEVLLDGQARPASQLPIARGEAVRLANFLPSAPVDPAELVRYVRDDMIRTAPLLERSVRIPLSERAHALDLLTPVVLRLPSGEVEKLTVALRWLSGQTELGADARAWRQWLDARARSRNAPTDAVQSTLALPDEPAYRQ